MLSQDDQEVCMPYQQFDQYLTLSLALPRDQPLVLISRGICGHTTCCITQTKNISSKKSRQKTRSCRFRYNIIKKCLSWVFMNSSNVKNKVLFLLITVLHTVQLYLNK